MHLESLNRVARSRTSVRHRGGIPSPPEYRQKQFLLLHHYQDRQRPGHKYTHKDYIHIAASHFLLKPSIPIKSISRKKIRPIAGIGDKERIMKYTVFMKKTLVQWGAGNIGRGLIGRIFATHQWNVHFIDVDRQLLQALRREGSYTVTCVDEHTRESIVVTPAHLVDGNDSKAVVGSIVRCDLLSLSVGKHVLPHIVPLLAEGLVARWEIDPERALDIILAENVLNGAQMVEDLIRGHLPKEYPLDTLAGFIQASIGTMVPLRDRSKSLEIDVEPYKQLFLDKDRFKGKIPDFPEISAVSPIEAYMDRKLFMHNLGHAAAAYIGHLRHPEAIHLCDVLKDREVFEAVQNAMEEGSDLLLSLYPETFTKEDLLEHREDLLKRFQNPVLKDTVYRVGRDLKRKLSFDDRLLGAMLKAERQGTSYRAIAEAYASALRFDARDEKGTLYGDDEEFFRQTRDLSVRERILFASGLTKEEFPSGLLQTIESFY